MKVEHNWLMAGHKLLIIEHRSTLDYAPGTLWAGGTIKIKHIYVPFCELYLCLLTRFQCYF